MKRLCELDVYILAKKLSDMVWDAFDRWPVKARNTMGYQIIRSCDSIAANMAEGYGRFSPADRRKFYLYARGPQEETKSWLRKAIRRQIIRSDDEIRAFKEVIDELGPKLNAFISKTTVDAVREAGPDAPISNFEFQLSSSESTERSETYAKKN